MKETKDKMNTADINLTKCELQAIYVKWWTDFIENPNEFKSEPTRIEDVEGFAQESADEFIRIMNELKNERGPKGRRHEKQ